MSTTTRRQRRVRANREGGATDGSTGARMLATVREICTFERRLTGTDAERRAANRMADHLAKAGRAVEVQPIHVHPQIGLVEGLHCLLAFAGSLVAVASPPVGFALALIAATSMYLDLNGRVYLLRLLFFRRASQNVVSRGDNPTAPATLLITANLDSARTGAFFEPKRMARRQRIARALPFPFGPFRILFWSIAAMLPLLGLRMAGIDAGVVSLLQLIPTLILLLGIFSLVDIELSDVVPGANDNASGAAVALELGTELHDSPPANLDVWVVLTGGEQCLSEGMRAFLRPRKKVFDRPTTFVLNLDAVGRGDLRYVTSQGPAVSFDMDPRLVELCAALSGSDDEHDGEEEVESVPQPRATPLAHGYSDDAFAARIARLRPISLTSMEPGAIAPPDFHTEADTPDRVEADALDHARDFAFELIAAIDRDVGRTIARNDD